MSDPITSARSAREYLGKGLAALQSPGVPPELMDVAEPIAHAMSALHRIEVSQGAAIGENGATALDAVRRALGMLQSQPAGAPVVDQAIEAVASSLSLVHSLTQSPAPNAAQPPLPQAASTTTQPIPQTGPQQGQFAPQPPAQLAPQPIAPQQPVAQPQQPVAQPQPIAPQQPVAQPQPGAQPLPPQAPHPEPVAQPPAPAPFGQQSPAQSSPLQAQPTAGPQQEPQPVPQSPPWQQPATPVADPSAMGLAGTAISDNATPAPAEAPQVGQPVPGWAAATALAAPGWPKAAAAPQPSAAPMPGHPAPLAAAVQAMPAPTPQPAPAPQPAAPQPSPKAQPTPGGDFVRVEAELGAHSVTNFYKGLSGNDVIDDGGIFIATYQVPPIGQNLIVHVSLPGGYEFEAKAVVRWTREHVGSSDHAPPGFGAQFFDIAPEGRQLVYRYVRNREPLFHDDL